MKITDEARDVLIPVLKENNKTGIRVYFGGFGWGGPNIGLALDEPELEDKIILINDIQVAMDPDLEEFTTDLILDFDRFRGSLVLLENDMGC